jgi:hypothetical protein
MFRLTIKKALAAAIGAAALATAGPANAGTTPSWDVSGAFCFAYGNTMVVTPNFGIMAANLYSYRGESQRVYARVALYSYNTGSWILTSHWIYGTAYDFTGPLQWTDLTTGQIFGSDGSAALTIDVYQRGTYLTKVQFAWDTSSAGAPGGTSDWFSEGVCAY